MHHILPGLPPYGALARACPPDWGARGREGLVVEFTTSTGRLWVGNFANGMNGIREVVQHPDGLRVLVFSGGDGWSVDIDGEDAQLLVHTIDGLWPVQGGLILSRQGLAFLRLGRDGVLWHTRRLSWDGFQNVRIDGDRLTASAWSPGSDEWAECSVDLRTGAASGGSYGDRDSEHWERLAST